MEITAAGNSGEILMSNGAGAPSWISTSSFITDSNFSADGILTRIGGAGNYVASTTLSVPYGGTGASTLTTNGILYGNGTGAIQATAEGTHNYILYSNNGTPSWMATSSLGLLDGSGVAGQIATWADNNTLTSSSTLSVAYGGTGLNSVTEGYVLTGLNGGALQATSSLFIASNGYIGIGTTAPSYLVDIVGSTTDEYLMRIFNESTSASSAGLFIRSDGDGNLLTLNASGNDIFTVSEAASTFNNPVMFGSAGDVSIAQDLVMTNGVAGNILFKGPGYLKTDSAFENLDLTLSAANNGMVVVSDGLWVTGSTSIDNASDIRFYESDTSGANYVGLRASTSLAGDVIWTLPLAEASASGYALTSDAAGQLSWSDLGSGGTVASGTTGYIPYYASYGDTLTATSALYIAESGNIGIGTTTPSYALTVAGDFMLTGGLYDNNYDNGTWGMVLQSTGSGVDWVATSSLGLGGGGGIDGSGVAGQIATWLDSDTLTTSSTLSVAYGGTGKGLSLVAGGIVYTDSDSMEITAAGNSGEILMSNGAGAPSWISTSTFVTDSNFTSNGIMVRTSSGNYTSRTITGTANEITVDNGDGVSANPTISLPDIVYLGTSGKIGRDADNLIDFSTDDLITFRTGGTDNVYIDSNGFLGIGTTTPSSALTVMSSAGTADASGL